MTNQAIEQFLSKIQQDPAGLKGYNARIQFDFTDTEESTLISFDGNNAHVVKDAQAPDCTVSISSKNFEKLTTGQMNPQTAFLMGKLKSKGDMSHLLRLSSLLTHYK